MLSSLLSRQAETENETSPLRAQLSAGVPESLTLEEFDRLARKNPFEPPPDGLFSHFYLNPPAGSQPPVRRRRRRMTTVINGPIACSKCGSLYKTRKSLRAHIRIQCGKEPNFHCPLCPKKTYQKIHIEVHMSRAHKIGGWRYNELIHNDWILFHVVKLCDLHLLQNWIIKPSFKYFTKLSKKTLTYIFFKNPALTAGESSFYGEKVIWIKILCTFYVFENRIFYWCFGDIHIW